MRTLVLGGTVFLSRAVAAEAVRRGHDVVCAARGSSGAVPDGAELVRADRDVPGGLSALTGRKFDAVVDVATMSYPWVRDALDLLAPAAEHWTFVSSINVYADAVTTGQDETAPLHEPARSGADKQERIAHPHLYGGIKVASENVVRDAMGERALVVRSGLIVGPGDVSDRFGYWVNRIARGGRVAVPDVLDQPVQLVDVRDMAAWIVSAGEQRTGGTCNGVGASRTLGDLLGAIVAAVGPPGTELVPVPVAELEAAGVQVWRGPRSLPLWVPPEDHGFMAHDHRRAEAAGLRTRPLGETAADVLADERRLGADRAREAGLTPDDEAALLAGGVVSGWQRIGDGDPDRVVLAVDYDSTARAEADFHDLAGLLRPSRELWLTAQPEEAETGLLGPQEYLARWGVRPTGGRVVAVTGFCVGCVWVPALADAIAAEQGSRPAVLLVDPEPMVVSSLLRDFRTVVDTLTSLERGERDAYTDEVRAICASTDDVTVAGGQVVKVYEAAAGVAFERIGFDDETTEDIVGVFRSYVSYLAAAWQLDPEAGWADGAALTSAGSSPGAPHAASEQSFPVASAELLADERVAAAVDRFLDEHAT